MDGRMDGWILYMLCMLCLYVHTNVHMLSILCEDALCVCVYVESFILCVPKLALHLSECIHLCHPCDVADPPTAVHPVPG